MKKYQEQLNKSKFNLIEIENKINQINFKVNLTKDNLIELNIRHKKIENIE